MSDTTTTPPISMDKNISKQMCKLLSLEYNVEKPDLLPFIAMLNIIHQEYAVTKPEVFHLLIAVLHDFNPYLGKEHRQRTIKYIELLLESQPVLCEYLTSILPEHTVHNTLSGMFGTLPIYKISPQVKMQSSRPTDCLDMTCSQTDGLPISHHSPVLPSAGTMANNHSYPPCLPGMSQGYKVVTPVYCSPWFTVSSATSGGTIAQSTGQRMFPSVRMTTAFCSPVSSEHSYGNAGQRKVSAFSLYDSLSAETTTHPSLDRFKNSSSFPYTQQIVLPGVKGQSLYFNSSSAILPSATMVNTIGRSDNNKPSQECLNEKVQKITGSNQLPEAAKNAFESKDCANNEIRNIYSRLFGTSVNMPSPVSRNENSKIPNVYPFGRLTPTNLSVSCPTISIENEIGPNSHLRNHFNISRYGVNSTKNAYPSSEAFDSNNVEGPSTASESQKPKRSSDSMDVLAHSLNLKVAKRDTYNLSDSRESGDSDKTMAHTLPGERQQSTITWSTKKDKHRRKKKRH